MLQIRISEKAWDTLEQSLQLDASSSAIDPELRAEIRAALESIQVMRVEEPKRYFPVRLTVDLKVYAHSYTDVEPILEGLHQEVEETVCGYSNDVGYVGTNFSWDPDDHWSDDPDEVGIGGNP